MNHKVNFILLHKPHAEAFAALIEQPSMKVALTYAMADFAATAESPDEIRGARKFLLLLTTLASTPVPVTHPDKSLKTF